MNESIQETSLNEKESNELRAKLRQAELDLEIDLMSPQEVIDYELRQCGLLDYLNRPYQWTPHEDSLSLKLTAILCRTDEAIPMMDSYSVGSQKRRGYLDYLAQRVAWMMLQEESVDSAQSQIKYYLNREGWYQIELPSENASVLEWGSAVTVYNLELQEWLKGQYTHNKADFQFPMELVPATNEVRERIESLTLEEWMISITTIYKEWD